MTLQAAPELPAPAPLGVRMMGDFGYCPWVHLSYLEGVTLAWHTGGDRAFVDFPTRTVSLRRGLSSAELRGALTHELVHLERGPGFGLEDSVRGRIEEEVVWVTSVLRQIPAVILEDLPELVDRFGQEAALAFLCIDSDHLMVALREVKRARSWVDDEPAEEGPDPACLSWNDGHDCGLTDGHPGDHQCIECGDVWNRGPWDDDADEWSHERPPVEERCASATPHASRVRA